MKIYLAALIIFLLAFAGLAIGIIFKRKGLKGSCTPGSNAGHDCRCKPETRPGMPTRTDRHSQRK